MLRLQPHVHFNMCVRAHGHTHTHTWAAVQRGTGDEGGVLQGQTPLSIFTGASPPPPLSAAMETLVLFRV